MTEVIQAAAKLQEVCQQHGWRFCFIGGIAVLRWGEPRVTVDADLTLLTGFGGEKPFIDILLQSFKGRIANPAQFALEHRVLLLQSAAGVGLDIALGALPFEELAVERASNFEYPPRVQLRTCSAEDLIVMKAFAGRGQDWVDIERVIIRQKPNLDWEHILRQLKPLAELKGEPEIITKLARLRKDFDHSF